jgi:release factor glutamine methyltransferase
MRILSFCEGVERSFIISHEESKLKNEECFLDALYKRANHTPLEYITKSVEFYSREFYIDSGALIPRPESEILVQKALEIIDKEGIKEILEVGVGSGILSITLALERDIKAVATDISKKALLVASKNIKRFNLKDKIELKEANLWQKEDERELIISNPPYVANSFEVAPELLYEPKNAIFGGANGDEILKKIVKKFYNSSAKYLICEMGYDQKEPMKKLFESLNLGDFEFYKDLSGLDRGFVLKKR